MLQTILAAVRRRLDCRAGALRLMAKEPELWWGVYEMTKAGNLPVASLYVSLSWLEQAGYVEAEFRNREDFKQPRRLYHITERGLSALANGLPKL